MLSRADVTRLALAVALFASVLLAPWWLPLTLAIALAARWRAGEVILAGILYDILWLPAAVSFTSFDTIPLATFISVILVFLCEPVRRRLLL